jgi:hypothetical protein
MSNIVTNIYRALENILHVDYGMWGNPSNSGRYPAESGPNPIQRAIDSVAAARNGDLITHRKASGQARRKKHRTQ